MEYAEYIRKFDALTARYIPQKADWTPSDHAVYSPSHYFRIEKREADDLRYKAVRFQLNRHYNGNRTYRTYCEEKGFHPDSLRSAEDLDQVPVVSADFFKTYPSGRDFALWLANIYTGELPRVRIRSKDPTPDEVIDSFNQAGMAVAYSSGTSGRHTFIPRDMRAFHSNEYSLSKGAISMFFPRWGPDMRSFLMMPNPFKTNLFAGRLGTVMYDIMKDVEVALDREVNTETVRQSMAKGDTLVSKLTKYVVSRTTQRSVDRIVSWIGERAKDGSRVALVGVPFMLHYVLNELKERGKTFDLSGRAMVLTGGGWKAHEDQRIPEDRFRKEVEELLGVEPENCLDMYGMVEGNGWMIQCPEGHHLHIPHSYLHPMVLDDDNNSLGYGKYGRFAFLDGSMGSYPGFVVTNDKVRMLEHCPHCDRPGPVLEPGVTRMPGKEVRGCGEEVRKMMAADVGGD
jgi:phenylacetate-coenzyme A ligase PaaK-like adenylate-forming protein